MRMYLKVSPEQINVFNHTKGINTTGFFFFSKTQDVNLTFKMRKKEIISRMVDLIFSDIFRPAE